MNKMLIISGIFSVICTIRVITQFNAVHALLYLVLSFLSVGLMFVFLGAPFAAALEVIIYAGAIMVLFIFMTMMFSLGDKTTEQERKWFQQVSWPEPILLIAVLLGELIYVCLSSNEKYFFVKQIDVKKVSLSLFGPYLIVVELASILLLAALIGAYHLGRNEAMRNESN